MGSAVPGASWCAFTTAPIGWSDVITAEYSRPSASPPVKRRSTNCERPGAIESGRLSIGGPSKVWNWTVAVATLAPMFWTMNVVSQPPADRVRYGRKSIVEPALMPLYESASWRTASRTFWCSFTTATIGAPNDLTTTDPAQPAPRSGSPFGSCTTEVPGARAVTVRVLKKRPSPPP